MIAVIARLIAIAYLPGALMFRAPVWERPRRAQLSAEERLFWAVMLSAAWSSLIGLALAGCGAFSLERLVAIDLAASVAIALRYRHRLRFHGTAPRPTWTTVVPLALIALGLYVFFPPSEYVIGGKDPGVYFNEGIQIAQRGTLIVHDPVVATVPPAFRDLFFPSHQNPAYYGLRFMGFFILDPATGAVVGQFPHLYPLWIAIGYGLDGLTGARRVTGLLAIVGLLALYFAGARLVNRTAAALAAGLAGVSLIEIWFARSVASEMLMQPMLLGSLLAITRAHVDGDRFFAPVGAVMLGLLLFLRFDAVLAVGGVLAALALGAAVTRRWPLSSFTIPFIAIGLLALLYFAKLMRPYAARPLEFLYFHWFLDIVLAALVVTLVLGAWMVARRPRLSERVRTWWPRTMVAATLAAAIYAYFFRRQGGLLAVHDAMALKTFTWYLPGGFVHGTAAPAGLIAALAGYALVVWRSFWRDPALLTVFTVYAFFTFYKIQIVPEHFWMARRFVPIIWPAALLLVSAAALYPLHRRRLTAAAANTPLQVWLRTGSRPRLIAPLLVPVLFIWLVGWNLFDRSRAILHHVEYAGIIPRLETLAGRFGDDELILVESRNASDLHVLALPLAYIYARNVLVLNTPRPDKTVFRQFLAWAGTRYRTVYFLGGGGTDLLSRSIGVQAVASDRFQVPEYESRTNAYPRGVRQKEFDFGLYRFTQRVQPAAWFSLDVGTMDDLHVSRFHAKERSEAATFRWTRDVSYVSLVGLPADGRLVTLWLHDGRRPAGIPPARVTVSFDDQPIGHVIVGPGFRPYSFNVPATLAEAAGTREAPALLKIATTTWNPQTALGTADDRELGVMVDKVEVR